jgi:hypothetical protein
VAEKGGILMTIPEKPYFMQNDEWYYFDEKEFIYKLTDKAPKEAVESYKEFYASVYNGSDGGVI